MASSKVTKSGTTSSRILRSMGLFSGVRIVGILCSLVRNKLIAIFVGPVGMGLVILLNSIVDIVSQATRLSIDQSAQRDISQASHAHAPSIISAVRKWTLWLGIAGTLVMCLISPLLSLATFETYDRWPEFCLLAVVPFFLTYNASVTAQNQGLKRFKALALGSTLGAIAGLVISIPLIILLRIDSILWIIITYGATAWLASYIFRPRMRSIELSSTEIVEKGREFIRLGALITASTLITLGLNYVFIVIFNTYWSTYQLGIYQAGYTLLNSYIGIVFAALFVEYYPRLSSMSHSPKRLSLAASHEARLTLSILAPLLCVFIFLAGFVITLIYSDDFIDAVPFVVLGCVGVIFRVTSWCLAYVILARGDGKTYIITEAVSSVLGLILNIVGYVYGGFLGLGIAYTAWYAIYTLIVALACQTRYGVRYDGTTWTVAAASLGLVTICAGIVLL